MSPFTHSIHLCGIFAGASVAMIAVQGVTARWRFAKALFAGENYLRSLIDNMIQSFVRCEVLYDRNGHPSDVLVLDSNPALTKMAGLSDLIGKRGSELIPGLFEFNPELLERSHRVASSGSPEKFEVRIAQLERWFCVSAYSTQRGEFVAIFCEITAQKKAEEALRASEARFRSYVENAPLAFLVADREGKIVESNLETSKLLGTEINVLGTNIVDLHPPKARPAVGHLMAALQAEGRVEKEVKILRADGRQLCVLLRAVMLDDGSSMAFLEDITGRKESEEHMRSLEEECRQAQKIEAVGRLAGGIAHDFNSLLTVIMGQTELLALALGGTHQQYTEGIMKSARRAAELTGKLLAFSRKQAIQPTVLTLNQVVSGVSDLLARLVGEDVHMTLALCEQPWSVLADRSQLEQVIMNLVVNARDAMPAGGRLTLETANCVIDEPYRQKHPVVPPGSYALLAVSDTGVGMSSEVKARLFEPFFTTKEPGKGTGLGLSMVYGIVKRSNGFIWAYSELGMGTTFKIYLPKAEVSSPTNTETIAPPPVRVNAKSTILLVEDDDSVRDLISEFLRSGGHTVLLANGVDEACQIFGERSEEIDLLLTDVVLKAGNGKELVSKLENCGYHFRRLYMSGYTPDAIVQHGVLDSGTQFLQKPFGRTTLLNKIDEVLGEPLGPAPKGRS